MKKFVLAVAALSCCCGSALATEKATGTFKVEKDCDAYLSFKKKTQPIKVHQGESYDVTEVNKPGDWDWVHISIKNDLRWISKQCGTADVKVASSPEKEHQKTSCSTANEFDSYVLATTWQPGFCEHDDYNGVKPECDAMMKDKIDVSHLTLHGLWPNKKSCGTKYGDCASTPLVLKDETKKEMAPWMPNFYYEQRFAEHEWSKHGTCQEKSADAYFLFAKDILQRMDSSVIGGYLKEHIGQKISTAAYQKAIEEKLGKDVADRMQIHCAKRQYLDEIRINLPKDVVADDNIGKMVAGAETFGKFAPGCDEEIYIEKSGKN
ncbi:ribonuclease T2 family protein [Candidatus Electronema sp. JM]|uniref:ribonuclease T2 family protein n=1 Tax=Candidatus Electronema sp. JM TaxID=3401571 RepID=UPI003AA8BA24